MSGGENRSVESHSQDAGNCSICGRPTAVHRAAEVKSCSVCRSRAHAECVENTEQLLLVGTSAPGHPYVCVSCREGPLVGGDVMMGGDADLLAYNRPHHIYGGVGIELDEEEVEEEEAEELEMDIEEGEEGEFVQEDQEASRSSIVEESLLPNHHHQSFSPTLPESSSIRRSTRSVAQRRLSPFLNPSADDTSSNQFDEETYTAVDVSSAQRTASYLSTLSSPSRGGGEEGTSGGGDSNRQLSDDGDDSPRATPQTDEEEEEEEAEVISDNDEYQPPSTAKKGGKGKGKGKGKAKPASAAQHSVAPRIVHSSSVPVARTSTTISKKSALLRQMSSMRTRSGGKPPTTSYAHIASLATMVVTEERGKKGPGRSVSLNTASPSNGGRMAQQSKSSRSRAGGCSGGRGSKFQSMSYLYGLKNKNGEEEVGGGGMGKGGGDSGVESLRSGSKQRQLDDEYVRTAIVTSAADKFMCSASLCLVCGSVGKDVEGTMVTCMSCAQSYHTYCVGLHEKLNNTVLKRGWRCLDCTHCEGCGRGSDESNLLLCDECDISFHTYCLDPPLSKIPHGAWRCKWCATCSRCSKLIQSGVDFHHLEGFCEACHSLKKCPKCRKPYEVEELLIKCQRCSRWLHGRCEELLTEEQLENAAENSFRCSLCRPQFGSFGDSLHSSVIIDNVMVNKAAAEQIQHLRRLMNADHYSHHHQLYPHHSHHLHHHHSYGHLPSAASYRSQSHDSRDDYEGLAESGDAGGGGAGIRQFNLGKGMGGGGPGRRISKVGVGGFSVKMPRRLQLSSVSTSASSQLPNNNNNEDDGDAELFTAEGKPRQRRPRKPKRPRMEDAYPPHIQESFFGAVSVDSKMLAETSIDEPVLPDVKKNSLEPLCNKTGCELSERSADALRSEQEADMLGEIFIGGNIDECFGLDDFNFSDLIGEEDGTEGGDMDDEGATAVDESLNNDAFSNTGSTRDLNMSGSGILSPSSVAMGPSSSHHHAHGTSQQYGTMGDEQRRRLLHARLNQSHAERAGAGNQATERWEEDEPLGDKATKAAVLYANLCHDELKTKYPNWNDRVKMINRVWRLLDADKRQEYVDMARRNRANGQIRQMRRPRKAVSSLSLAGTGLEGGDGDGRGALGSWDADTPGPSGGGGGGEGGQSSSSYDFVVRAHIDAIKQAQAQQSQQKQQLQQLPRDAVGTAKNDTLEVQHPANQHPTGKPTDVNQDEADADVAQRYVIMRKITADLDRELKAKQDELGRLKRFKKNTLARYRQQQLARGPPPGVDEGESPAIVLSPEVSRTVEKTKVQIDDQQEAVEKCKREMRTHHQRVEEFEQRHRNELALINNSRMGDSHHQSPTNPTQQPPLAATPVTPFSPRPGRPSALQLAMRLQMADGNGGSSSNTSTPNRPGSSASVVGVVDPLAKPTRGRKRKRPLHPSEVRRSPMLGGVAFETLVDQLERDVYDTVDYMLACVTLGVPPALNSSHLAVQRILHSQAPLSTAADGVAGSEPRQRKQRRQMSNSKKQQQQQQTSGELANEHEVQLERLRTQLDLIPLPTRSCEDYSSFDKNVANTRHTTHLSDPHIRGIELGGYKLSFLTPEYYDGVEEEVREELEVSEDERAWNQLEELLPPPMAEICGGVDFDALLAEEDENGPPAPPFTDTKPIVDGIKPPTTVLPSQQISQWTDLAHLSLNSLNDRVEFGKGSLPLPMLCCTFQHSCDLNREPPAEPHRSLFYKPMLDIENREYKVTLTIDPNEATARTTEELIGQLRDFLGEDKPLVYSVDTPPQSPQSSQHQQHQSREIKMEVDDGGEVVTNHVGHHHYAEESHAACPANAHTVKSEGGVEEEGDMNSELPTANLGSEERTMLLDDLKRSRENAVRVTDIASMAATADAVKTATAPAARGEFKWRGHGWMVCDPQLVQSFQQPEDEVRQKFAAIHLQSSFGGARSRASRQEDSRECVLCGASGDGDQETSGRLLNVDANEWVHVNCALWSSEVHESEDGALLNVESAIRRAKQIECLVCGRNGASLKCYKMECSGAKPSCGYHLLCAYQRGGNFVRDKTFYCPEHDVKREMRVERLDSLRRIYVQREENQLLAKIFSHSHSTEMMMRVGNLLFHKIGQLLPEQLKSFHTHDYIYPIGYHITRIFWSPVNPRDQCLYECVVTDCNNQPQFCVTFDQKEFREKTSSEAWSRILRSVSALREKADNVLLKFFPDLISGEQLFGFTEPAITKMIESLPGVDQLFTYNFKHGGTPLMDLPLAVNPSGCARCEPCFRTLIKHYRKPLVSNSPKKKPPFIGTSSAGSAFNAEVIPREARSTRSASTRFNPIASKLDQETIRAYKASGITEEMLQSPYFRYEPGQPAPHQIHSQYRRLQKEWPNNVYLARSRIQGLGLYAKRDIDMNSMIIEYKGEVIRSEVGEMREKKYMSQNRGVYMFRVDDEYIIDATLSGGLARYVNHSCDPNCSTKILPYNDDKKIIITANRPIRQGEELTYDYQFDLEDTSEKIPCLCGAPNCNKWMN